MKIQVLGTGCAKCQKLTENVRHAVTSLGVVCEIEKVTDIDRITEFGVMVTPALLIDGKLISSGKVLSIDEISAFLTPCDCASSTNSPRSCSRINPWKKYLTSSLLLFVFGSVAYMIVRESRTPEISHPATLMPTETKALIVYYFHGNQRCFTCKKIEELAQKAISEKYAEALSDGRVIFKSVNLEESVNEHYINDFQLTTRSMVMQKNGKYEKLDAVWTLVHEPEKFTAYIQNGAAEMLK